MCHRSHMEVRGQIIGVWRIKFKSPGRAANWQQVLYQVIAAALNYISDNIIELYNLRA